MYKIVHRTEDGNLVSPFSIDKYKVAYNPYKRTYPLIGKLFVYNDIDIALEVIEHTSNDNLEIWECEVGNAEHWYFVPVNNIPSIWETYWRCGTGSLISVIGTPPETYACDWVMITRRVQ